MNSNLQPMRVIKMDTKSEAKANLTRSPEETHTPAELEAVHRAVRYTQLFKHEESMEKMNEEEVIERTMPDLKKLYEKNKRS